MINLVLWLVVILLCPPKDVYSAASYQNTEQSWKKNKQLSMTTFKTHQWGNWKRASIFISFICQSHLRTLPLEWQHSYIYIPAVLFLLRWHYYEGQEPCPLYKCITRLRRKAICITYCWIYSRPSLEGSKSFVAYFSVKKMDRFLQRNVV